MTHRLPRAVPSAPGFEHQPLVEDVLAAVRDAAADLLSSSPRPPASLNVRVGDVAVEMTWPQATAAAPVVPAEGDEIAPGQQVAIIEAMKLMLPVEAELGGRIAEVLVTDGEGVEFGQPLFRLAAVDADLAA